MALLPQTEEPFRLDFWPRRNLDRLLVAACLLIVVFCSLMLLTYPFGRDQGIFAVIGQGLLNGKMPYRELWDVKTPGIFFVFALGEALFGHTMLAPRVLEALALTGTVALMVSLSRRWFGDPIAGYIGGALLAIANFQLDFWHSNQPETYGGMLLIAAAWLLSNASVRRRWLRFCLGGVLLGLVVLMKPHLGLAVPPLIWLCGDSSRPSLKRRAWDALPVLVGGTSVVLAVAAWLWLGGAWSIAVWTWRDFAPGYTSISGERSWGDFYAGLYGVTVTLFCQFSALFVSGVVLELAVGSPKTPERQRFWGLLGIVFCLAVAVTVQQKSFRYHFVAAFPLLALAAGLGWAKLWRLASRGTGRYSVAFLLAFGAAYLARFPVTDLNGSIHERTRIRLAQLLGGRAPHGPATAASSLYAVRKNFDLGEAQAVAAWVRQELTPNETLLLWGCDSIVYWLSERRPATRFVHNMPQRGSWQREKARSRFMDEVRRSRPRAIVVQHGDFITSVIGEREDSATALRSFPELTAYLKDGFELMTTIGKFDVYVR
jgi:hypothetical protein